MPGSSDASPTSSDSSTSRLVSHSDDLSLPTVVVTVPRRCSHDDVIAEDDHVTNMAANDTAPEVDRPSGGGGGGVGGGRLPVIRTVDERGSVQVKTSKANGIWSGGGGRITPVETSPCLLRPGELHRRLNAVVRDRIIFFTRKDRSLSAARDRSPSTQRC